MKISIITINYNDKTGLERTIKSVIAQKCNAYEYIVVENHKGVFEETIGQMNEDGISLVGAVHDYTDPATGKGYLYFPIREV